MYICEKCGKEVYEKYGSGRFCSRQCANSRNFSESAKRKKSIAAKGRTAYSNGEKVLFIRKGDIVPNNFYKGNYSIAKNYSSIAEFADRDNKDSFKKKLSNKELLIFCQNYIDEHNKEIIEKYECLLKKKASNKSEYFDNQVLSSKYYAIKQHHPREHAGWIFVHILLAERLLDRQLDEFEIVHHRDLNKLNNTFDNIYIFDNNRSHLRFHYSKYYWLKISNDVLICEKIDYSKLRSYYEQSINKLI